MLNERITLKFIELLNKNQVGEVQNYLHENVSITSFILSEGKYRLLEGKSNIIELLKTNFSFGDANIDVKKIISNENTVAISSVLSGSNYYEIENLHFEIKVMIFVEFTDHKISYIDFSSDTFEIMRLTGRALMTLGDQQKIRNYFEFLKNVGMLPEQFSHS